MLSASASLNSPGHLRVTLMCGRVVNLPRKHVFFGGGQALTSSPAPNTQAVMATAKTDAEQHAGAAQRENANFACAEETPNAMAAEGSVQRADNAVPLKKSDTSVVATTIAPEVAMRVATNEMIGGNASSVYKTVQQKLTAVSAVLGTQALKASHVLVKAYQQLTTPTLGVGVATPFGHGRLIGPLEGSDAVGVRPPTTRRMPPDVAAMMPVQLWKVRLHHGAIVALPLHQLKFGAGSKIKPETPSAEGLVTPFADPDLYGRRLPHMGPAVPRLDLSMVVPTMHLLEGLDVHKGVRRRRK